MEAPAEKRFGVEVLMTIIMIFDSDSTGKFDDMVSALICRGSYMYAERSWILI